MPAPFPGGQQQPAKCARHAAWRVPATSLPAARAPAALRSFARPVARPPAIRPFTSWTSPTQFPRLPTTPTPCPHKPHVSADELGSGTCRRATNGYVSRNCARRSSHSAQCSRHESSSNTCTDALGLGNNKHSVPCSLTPPHLRLRTYPARQNHREPRRPPRAARLLQFCGCSTP